MHEAVIGKGISECLRICMISMEALGSIGVMLMVERNRFISFKVSIGTERLDAYGKFVLALMLRM